MAPNFSVAWRTAATTAAVSASDSVRSGACKRRRNARLREPSATPGAAIDVEQLEADEQVAGALADRPVELLGRYVVGEHERHVEVARRVTARRLPRRRLRLGGERDRQVRARERRRARRCRTRRARRARSRRRPRCGRVRRAAWPTASGGARPAPVPGRCGRRCRALRRSHATRPRRPAPPGRRGRRRATRARRAGRPCRAGRRGRSRTATTPGRRCDSLNATALSSPGRSDVRSTSSSATSGFVMCSASVSSPVRSRSTLDRNGDGSTSVMPRPTSTLRRSPAALLDRREMAVQRRLRHQLGDVRVAVVAADLFDDVDLLGRVGPPRRQRDGQRLGVVARRR